ncbi:MAG: diaminopimelate epimerase [Candidatus Eremiobacteraeota bacterium]|nr:diaminopimelate epimerase [Candidatus Eremiobacteraeota bacterium]
MSESVAIAKMHGARNDFVVLDARRSKVGSLAHFARSVCDRRTGVGADGLIVIESSTESDVRMRTINADGSEAEMCGNGVRCAARFLDEQGEGDRIAFETAAGLIHTEVVAREPEYQVRVAMATPRIAPHSVPFLEDARFVDMGNPHVVLFRKHVDDVEIAMLATRLQTHSLFPKGTNVHVAAVEGPDRLRVRHWERGVGLTMACGTGAVACAAAAIEKKLVQSPVEVFVPGGRLVVEWTGGPAHLTGPAERVFDANVAVETALAR